MVRPQKTLALLTVAIPVFTAGTEAQRGKSVDGASVPSQTVRSASFPLNFISGEALASLPGPHSCLLLLSVFFLDLPLSYLLCDLKLVTQAFRALVSHLRYFRNSA